jgi:hypothetical protein
LAFGEVNLHTNRFVDISAMSVFKLADCLFRVIDVATGQRLGTIHQTLDVDASDLRAELPIKLNSQFVVMLTCQDKQTVFVIYKLEDVRKANNQTVTPINEVKVIYFVILR